MKRGDVVVIKEDRFNTPRKVTRVLKDGRVQVGKHTWCADALREPTESEMRTFNLAERAAKVTDDLKGWQILLTEDEVAALEDVYQKLMSRLLAEREVAE